MTTKARHQLLITSVILIILAVILIASLNLLHGVNWIVVSTSFVAVIIGLSSPAIVKPAIKPKMFKVVFSSSIILVAIIIILNLFVKAKLMIGVGLVYFIACQISAIVLLQENRQNKNKHI
ncbi:hypothetical protein [Companilactobacillus ginsenosidimutans]|uniref:Uncharacterized protein n=1 Tax=Companilactobacillus ginsenosidimutans TaxID=1007676 RepID=A0A0H4QL14_9LACO|nr:hypothetical protein [Companilactobacillus ginsenosidimutans]AKP67801.1 hypothetical protein ABM34_09825 [Companilactobacillus ginsenosidimutans]